jgi:hypothetical protein
MMPTVIKLCLRCLGHSSAANIPRASRRYPSSLEEMAWSRSRPPRRGAADADRRIEQRRRLADPPPRLTPGDLGSKRPAALHRDQPQRLDLRLGGRRRSPCRPAAMAASLDPSVLLMGFLGLRLHLVGDPLDGRPAFAQWGGIRAGEGKRLLVEPLPARATGLGVRDWVMGAARSDPAALFTSPLLWLRLRVVISGRGLLAGS